MENMNVSSADVDCFVCGMEYGKKKNKPHLQLYIRFSMYPNRNDLMKKFKNVFGFSFTDTNVVWWFQFARADSAVNLKYCSKTGNYFKFGNFEANYNGKRNDLKELHRKIMEEKYTEEELVKDPETFKYMVYHGNNLAKTVGIAQSISTKQPPVVHVYTGIPHSGITLNKF